MITPRNGFQSGEQFFPLLAEAQKHELKLLLDGASLNDIPQAIVEHADKILDILTTKPGSRARARKINGGKKSRKTDTKATEQQELVKH